MMNRKNLTGRGGFLPLGDSGGSFVAPTPTLVSVLCELRVNAGASRSALSQRTEISHNVPPSRPVPLRG